MIKICIFFILILDVAFLDVIPVNMSSDEMSVFEQDLQEIRISTSSITLIAYDT